MVFLIYLIKALELNLNTLIILFFIKKMKKNVNYKEIILNYLIRDN